MEEAHSHVSTQVAGTMGYMPPEYFQGSMIATPMIDVYSFGVLMLEIATGRRPNWPFKEDGREIRIVEWCTKMVAQNKEMKIIDSAISNEELKAKQVVEFFRIAMLCTDEAAPKHRPTMNKIRALMVKLNEEKSAAIQQGNKLHQELEQLMRSPGNRSQGGVSVKFVAIVGLISILVGYLMKRT